MVVKKIHMLLNYSINKSTSSNSVLKVKTVVVTSLSRRLQLHTQTASSIEPTLTWTIKVNQQMLSHSPCNIIKQIMWVLFIKMRLMTVQKSASSKWKKRKRVLSMLSHWDCHTPILEATFKKLTFLSQSCILCRFINRWVGQRTQQMLLLCKIKDSVWPRTQSLIICSRMITHQPWWWVVLTSSLRQLKFFQSIRVSNTATPSVSTKMPIEADSNQQLLILKLQINHLHSRSKRVRQPRCSNNTTQACRHQSLHIGRLLTILSRLQLDHRLNLLTNTILRQSKQLRIKGSIYHR